ncbi:MAG: hypothetical protein O3A66_02585, partial [Proteobacteria bacterium]|nr:hypothetical protein [Pseudomonadota bacterium]
SGNISIIGKREEDGEVVWSGYLRNFHIKMKKFGFHPLKSKINVVYKNHIISFKDLKMRDKNHTVFFTGNINTQSFVTNAKIFYTPSKVEFLNEIPFLKDAFKLTTLGGSKKGLVSLELDATGSIFEPTIKFKKSSSVTSLWKFSIGVVLLPLLLL